MYKNTLLLVLSIFIFTSCATHLTKEYEIENLVLTAEGPLYEGTNTMQGMHSLLLGKIDPQLVPQQIEHVKLLSAKLEMNDSIGFDRIRSIALQLASEDTPMQQAAILNPVVPGTSTLEMKPSSEADFSKLFKQEKVFVIADVDLISDLESDLNYKISMKFDVKYKQ